MPNIGPKFILSNWTILFYVIVRQNSLILGRFFRFSKYFLTTNAVIVFIECEINRFTRQYDSLYLSLGGSLLFKRNDLLTHSFFILFSRVYFRKHPSNPLTKTILLWRYKTIPSLRAITFNFYIKHSCNIFILFHFIFLI